jgi:hypothetical protein
MSYPQIAAPRRTVFAHSQVIIKMEGKETLAPIGADADG